MIGVMALIASGCTSPQVRTPNADISSQACHSITGEFETYYTSVSDPLLVFGKPITDAFQDPLTGNTVQYFNRARFELHLDASAGRRVQLSPLGTWRDHKGKVAQFSTDSPACRYFPETNHYVCYGFLDFFNQNGGVEQFGLPITEVIWQDDRYVQYFERARFEWHPENSGNGIVLLTDLGRIDFDERIGDPKLLECSTGGATGVSITGEKVKINTLLARAFVAKAVTRPSSEQVLYVIVQNQDYKPVERASVAVTVIYPDGRAHTVALQPTDGDGLSSYNFQVENLPSDEVVQLKIEVSYNDLKTAAGSWFRVWW